LLSIIGSQSEVKMYSNRLWVFLLFVSLLISCSDRKKELPDDTPVEFTVSVSDSTFSISANQTFSIDYTVVSDSTIALETTVATTPTLGVVQIDPSSQSISFVAGNEPGSGEFTIDYTFANITQSVTFNYTITPDDSGGGNNGGNGGGSGGENGEGNNEPDPYGYQITWPTDYITAFEKEQLSIKLNRNYTDEENVLESFYLNAANMTGRLSPDGTEYHIFVDDAEEDTYGELVAVAEFEGEVYRNEMQIIYFNKNRDLQTPEAPIIALIEPEITLNVGKTSTLTFDVYDPDSDRLAYRILSAPLEVTTHINREPEGFELSVSLLAPFASTENELILEVSDAHNTVQISIALIIEDATPTTNTPPIVKLEENISVSLTKRMTGNETDKIAQFAFILEDEIPEFVDLSLTSSDTSFEFDINYPYIDIYAQDISELQHEQITLRATDGNFESKLTFHLYVKNNYLEFLGGHPNVPPIIEVNDVPPILESKSASFTVIGSDFEQHDFSLSVSANATYLSATVIDNVITLDTQLLLENTVVTTDLEITATDIFGSSRTLNVPITIYKNSAPVITASSQAIDIVEQGSLEYDVTVADVDQEITNIEFFYDESVMSVDYENGVMTINANNLTSEFTGVLIIRATDEFNAVTELEMPVIIRIDNQPPVIFASQTEIELAPGQTKTILMTYNDPDGTPLTINRFTNSEELTHAYDASRGILTLTLDQDAEFAQSMSFTTTASDGFISVSETITVIVPVAPAAPNLTLLEYNDTVNEDEVLIINFLISDDNGDLVNVTVTDGPTGNLADLDIVVYQSFLEITAPPNVLENRLYNLNVVATDDSESAQSTTQTIEFTVLPVNDPPEITISGNQFSLINDDITVIGLSIADIDNDPEDFEIEIETADGRDLPTTLTVHGLDVNSLRISGAQKGVVVPLTELVLTVNDGISFTRKSVFIKVDLDNQPPQFDNAVDVVQLTENSSVYFDVPATDPDASTDGDIVTISELRVGNTSGAGTISTTVNGVVVKTEAGLAFTVTAVEIYPTNTRITISAGEVTGNLGSFVQVVATDGYVTVLHPVTILVTDTTPPE
jgi:hypothetical protein